MEKSGEKAGERAGRAAGRKMGEEFGKSNRDMDREMSSFEKSFKRTTERAASHLSGSLSPEIKKVKRDLDELHDLRIGVDVSANKAHEELRRLQDRIRGLKNHVDIDVRVGATKALAELAVFNRALDRIDGRRVRPDIDTRGLKKATTDGVDAANTFRSFNAVILAATALGPALIPVLGGIAAGLAAIAPAAAVAGTSLTAVIIGFSGIGNALTALGNRQDQAAKTAETAAKQQRAATYGIRDAQLALESAVRSAARSEADAARHVADARRSASEQIKSAMDRQRTAAQSYRDSVNEVRQAEADLRQARKDAANEGRNIDVKIRENQLARDQGLIDEFNTRTKYLSVVNDGASTNLDKEQARIDMEQARLHMEELRNEQKDLAAQKRKWDKQGVNGVDAVKAAQDQLNSAIRRQRNAYQELGRASRAVDLARAAGARDVANAIREQNRTLADNKRSITQAREQLRRAREASDEVTKSINSQDQAVDAAFAKLGPAGRRFALFLWGLRHQWEAFRARIQQAMLPSIQHAMASFIDSRASRILQTAMVRLARGFGHFTIALSKSFRGPVWIHFFQMLANLGPKIQRAYGRAFILFLDMMARILTILAPYALRFARGLARMMDGFDRWAKSKEGTRTIRSFMDWAAAEGPKIAKALGAIVVAVIDLAVALTPWGTTVLNTLARFAELLSNMDPKILGALATGLLALVASSQMVYGLMTLRLAFGALAALGSMGPVVIIIMAVAAAIAALYSTNEEFRNKIKPLWAELGQALKDLWNQALKPLFDWLGPKIIWYIKFAVPILIRWWIFLAKTINFVIRFILIPVLKVWEWWMKFLWKRIVAPILKLVAGYFMIQFKVIKWTWDHILHPVLVAIGRVLKVLYVLFVKPYLQMIGTQWRLMGRGIKWVYDHTIGPVFDYIRQKALPRLKRSFELAVEGIKTIWNGLKKFIGKPIHFVLDSIINKGLIRGFNKVAAFVHEKGIDPVPVPKWTYARGGIMPGYTPGRDVHRFRSPTGGQLELSGGEAIMRPEWTQAIGPGMVHYMNKLAASGGVKAIRRAMGFAHGGILPPPTMWSAHPHSQYPWTRWAGDINGRGRNDYGDPVRPYLPGTVAKVVYLGDRSYGRYIVINHPGDMKTLYAHLSAALVKPGQKVDLRTVIGRVGDLGNATGPHLHLEISGGHEPLGISGGSDGGSLPGWLGAIFGGPAKWLKDKISGVTKGIGEKFGPFGTLMKDLTGSLIRPLAGRVKDMIGNFAGHFSPMGMAGAAIGAIKNLFGGSVEKTVRNIAKTFGWGSGGQWDALSTLINHESGWNPKAKNPSSTAYGLFQFLDSTWAGTGIGKTGDVGRQTLAGLRYIKSRYGSPEGAWNFWSGHHWYNKGGIVGEEAPVGSASAAAMPYNGTMMYDNGGMLPPGITTVMNLTRKPEPVFTHDQWDHVRNGEGGSIHYEPHFHRTDLTSRDVAFDLDLEFRRLSRGSKRYTGSN